jgi:hypothetical protein
MAYSQDIADRVCAELAKGRALRAVCRENAEFPSEAAIREWALKDICGFAAQYARARDLGLDAMADELLEISDTPQMGQKVTEKASGEEVTTGDMIEHRRLRVDTRKWYLSKVAPKKYGDRTALDVSGTLSISDRMQRAEKSADAS